MIGIVLLALVVLVYRIKARLFTRQEAALLAVVLIPVLMTVAQSLAESKFTRLSLPEMRYWWQATIPLFGYAVWGLEKCFSGKLKVSEFVKRSELKHSKLSTRTLLLIISLFALYDGIMLVKAHVPVGRRNAYIRVCKWAEERIRSDWKGPAEDKSVAHYDFEYRSLKRPIVQAHTARLPYILGGRNNSVGDHFADDTPDYICDEEKNINLAARGLHGAKYELMDKCQIGKRKFALYRRIDR